MELRIKTLVYNKFGQLEELDLGEVPTNRHDIVRAHENNQGFSYGAHHDCYVEVETAATLSVVQAIAAAIALVIFVGFGIAAAFTK